MPESCPHDLAERESAIHDGACPMCMASTFASAMLEMEKEIDRLRVQCDGLAKAAMANGMELLANEAAGTWNDAIEAAAQRANAAFLLDPLTAPAEAIRGLKRGEAQGLAEATDKT